MECMNKQQQAEMTNTRNHPSPFKVFQLNNINLNVLLLKQ